MLEANMGAPSANRLFLEKIYWLNQLKGELPETTLIPDFVRPRHGGVKNQVVVFELEEAISRVVIDLGQGSEVSVYVFLLSVVNSLLTQYTRCYDFIVGVPAYSVEGANQGGNVALPLRGQINPDVSFKDFLLQTKADLIHTYLHQNYPLEYLHPLLDKPHDPNRQPLFDIVVLLENIHDPAAMAQHHSGRSIAQLKTDLTIAFAIDGDRITGRIDYSDLLFAAETIQQFGRACVNGIESLVRQPTTAIQDIAFLKPSDQQQQFAFNSLPAPYPLHQTINQLFERQVAQTPDQIAAVWHETRLTYRDLNEQANQLGRQLRQAGLNPGEFVGILKGRDPHFLTAILAIHKAGGAYVPIDSTYPSDRIRYMLTDSKVRFLLTDATTLEALSDLFSDWGQADFGVEYLICLDDLPEQFTSPETVKVRDRTTLTQFSTDNLPEQHSAIYPAYMLYTSGSTGRPKGAIIRHDGAVNHIYAQREALELRPSFNFLQSAPASSDISVWQFLGPLLTGGKTVILDTEAVCNPEVLLRVLQSESLTLAELVPGVLKALIDHASQLPQEQRSLPQLKWMMVTGEYVAVEIVNQWLQLYPNIAIVNAYGPTEAADDITQAVLTQPLPANQRTVPIGHPLANLSLYVLDPQTRLLPIGAPGEIAVSGIGVGNGYWQNPVKTSASFVPNPFLSPDDIETSHHRLIYKTGDLGRWRADGSLEFLGRIDNQVQIRGFRIELGEIEAVLMQHPAIDETVVLVREDYPGRQMLVAYWVASAGPGQMTKLEAAFEVGSEMGDDVPAQLRQFLQEQLPEHMVPSAFVLLERLPRTPNGKIDRRSLPAPNPMRSDKQSYVAPRTPVERAIAEIWQHILGIEQVGIHDNFFDLGGHSLLITQLFTRLNNTFEVKVSLRRLFNAPTIASIAQEVQRLQQDPNAESEPEPVIDFATEAQLDPTIQPEGSAYESDRLPTAILLTGATGFLGAFLLYEVLQQTQADIYCLVRATNTEAGGQKIQDNLLAYQLWDDAFKLRINPVIGDLSQPHLGMSDAVFAELAARLDVIYHSGAQVNAIAPYEAFKAANVLGTQEVLRLANQVKIKPMHFVSSTGVVPSAQAGANAIQEDSPLELTALPGSGYARSKWVAEKLVVAARDRGLPVCIYRPGFITGHSKTGVCNTDDIIYRMIKGCIQIGSLPNLEVTLDLNPCDYVSQAIVHLSSQKDSLNQVFHLVNPQPISMATVFQYISALGYPLEFTDYASWRAKLLTQGTAENALYPLIPAFAAQEKLVPEAGSMNMIAEPSPPSKSCPVVQPFDARNTQMGLARSPVSCPALDKTLLDNYFTHLVHSGFLTPPIRVASRV
ncbi:MAG: amino acid adenylation domain-containing protein [Leptolyngbyaceae bacterium]|nr:amino acid adenylation domain-containing protein [Leptolyngbyaceae bacterium]